MCSRMVTLLAGGAPGLYHQAIIGEFGFRQCMTEIRSD
uniref:Uncharacterized protein n=1 Tax=Arundo donax TaxID=35708 RepID=A0A0A9HCQ2_ARUDO